MTRGDWLRRGRARRAVDVVRGVVYILAVAFAMVFGAVFTCIGGGVMGVVVLQLEDSLSVNWYAMILGVTVFVGGLVLMVVSQRSVFRRTQRGWERRKKTTRVRILDRPAKRYVMSFLDNHGAGGQS